MFSSQGLGGGARRANVICSSLRRERATRAGACWANPSSPGPRARAPLNEACTFRLCGGAGTQLRPCHGASGWPGPLGAPDDIRPPGAPGVGKAVAPQARMASATPMATEGKAAACWSSPGVLGAVSDPGPDPSCHSPRVAVHKLLDSSEPQFPHLGIKKEQQPRPQGELSERQ